MIKILNLVDLNKGSINYKITRYPDGQQDITLLDGPEEGNINYARLSYVLKGPVQIRSRFNSFNDLELIIAATKALRNLGVKEIQLFIPYLLGARSDRQFAYGGTSYLRDVVAPIINAQGYESVTVLDPHSDVAEAIINNLKIYTPYPFIEVAIKLIFGTNWNQRTARPFTLISPDAGALKKIYNAAAYIEYNGDIIIASKHREISTGKILETVVPVTPAHQMQDFVIIDDICDGGRTFIEIAKTIKKNLGEQRVGKIYLIVTHGIFSAGFEELVKYFTAIYTTNSVSDKDSGIEGTNSPDFLTRINVF